MTAEASTRTPPRRFALAALHGWWLLAGTATLAALIAFPVYKGVWAGLVPVAIGLLLAAAPLGMGRRIFARVTSILYAPGKWRWLLGVLLFGVIVRLPGVAFPPTPVSDHALYLSTGESVAAGGGFGDSITFPPGPSAVVAFAIWLFGKDIHVLTAFQSSLGLMTVVILYLGLRKYSEEAARWGSLAAALWPSIVLWNGTFGYETLDGLLFVAIFLLVSPARVDGRIPWGTLLFAGALVGAQALVHPTGPAIPFLAGLTWWLQGNTARRALAGFAIMFVAMAAVISPWAVRNYEKFHEFCPISANFGNVLLSANDPRSDGIYFSGIPSLPTSKPCERDRLRTRQALATMAADPARAALLVVKRIAFMWGTDTSGLGYVVGDVDGAPPRGGKLVKALLSFIVQVSWAWLGLAWCLTVWRRGDQRLTEPVDWTLPLLWIALLWILHAFVEPNSRHHLPIVPLLAAIVLPSYWALVGKRYAYAPQHANASHAEMLANFPD